MSTVSMMLAVNLDRPGTYLHWSIFVVSEANLVLIGVMVLIFAAALFVRFPGHPDTGAARPPSANGTGVVDEPEDPTMWTARVRRAALRVLPPGKLLPDRQPAYVASWIYVFGVATLAALAVVIVSGLVIAIGGPDWWHTNALGHFFNSLHLWSVELFMAFMVIHLWGKFWMAAWRGRRWLTWMTGVVAFGASVLECFTGYLSQQNFDSQWISTNGKDAINSIGIGGFFNLTNFGQMLMWHILLIPILLVALVGAHILLVRVRGVAHPLPATRAVGRDARRAARAADRATWDGPTRRYDILKEATVATAVVLGLVIALAAVLSSPDEPPVTVATWAKAAPADFIATAASELAGTSETATYGPPYNPSTSSSSNVQRVGFSWQTLTGVEIPVNPAKAFVLSPLSKLGANDPALAAAVTRYETAPGQTQLAWSQAYLKAVPRVRFVGGRPVVPAAADGPLPTLMAGELALARGGGIDADLLANRAFYGTDFTEPLLFLEDGQYFSNLAQAQHLTGAQWGVMNETGSYPGQPWLWLYTLWYQLPGFRSSANVDLIAIYLTAAATLLLLAVPFVPGLRDVPEVVPLHRIVWRQWHQRGGGTPGAGSVPTEPRAAPSPQSAQPPSSSPESVGPTPAG